MRRAAPMCWCTRCTVRHTFVPRIDRAARPGPPTCAPSTPATSRSASSPPRRPRGWCCSPTSSGWAPPTRSCSPACAPAATPAGWWWGPTSRAGRAGASAGILPPIPTPEPRVTIFELIAVLTTLAACFAWANYRFIRLPMTIGLMILALVGSLALVLAGRLGFAPIEDLTGFVANINFDGAVLNGMLGALLFAGALHVDLDRLLAHRGVILALATFSVL